MRGVVRTVALVGGAVLAVAGGLAVARAGVNFSDLSSSGVALLQLVIGLGVVGLVLLPDTTPAD